MVASPFTILHQRATENWFVGRDIEQFNQLTRDRFQQLQQHQTPPTIFLAEADPMCFLSSFLAAVAANCSLFLCNPNWGQQEWQQAIAIAQPDLIWGNIPSLSPQNQPTVNSPQGIFIPTGGSSGKIRFSVHTWDTLTASVAGFYQYFDSQPVNAFCVLPLYHVSGLMQFLRSFLTGGYFFLLPYQQLKEGKQGDINPADFFISLVPTQLQFLLASAPHWLSRFQTVLLGGAPAWEDLLNEARRHQIKLAPTYGMTETASQVVTLKPASFLAGNNSSGRVLSHACVKIIDTEDRVLNNSKLGKIAIQSKSLCLGYYPENSQFFRQTQTFSTDDLGYFDSQGYLHVVGRNSTKIVTGGENVFPAEVEAALLATQLVADVGVIGLPDRQWGEAVTAIYVPVRDRVSPATLKLAITEKISKYKQPKYWLEVANIPRNAQGKVNYLKLREMAEKSLLNSSPV